MTINKDKTILSLFDYSGEWSKPYLENGYNVIRVDIKLEDKPNNIFGLTNSYLDNIKPIYGILAAPPCTCFSGAGARWWKRQDEEGETANNLSMIYKTLDIIKYCDSCFWVLENPVGRLNRLVPELKEWGPMYFQPYHYGDFYRKKTGLWGKFNFPLATNVVEPLGIRKGQPDEWYSKVGGKSEKTKEYRSKTPSGFANAFYDCNK